MKITNIALMLIVGMFVSTSVVAFEDVGYSLPMAQSLYASAKVDDYHDLDFRSYSVIGDDNLNIEATDKSTAHNIYGGGKEEVGWRKLSNYED